MKLKLLYSVLTIFLFGFNGYAQLLDKLKERAKEKGLETQEVSFDSTNNEKHRTTSYEAEKLTINTASDFFTNDVVMDLYNKDGQLVQSSYFDAETIAMRTEQVGRKDPIYHDSKGYFYGFNQEVNHYEKMQILPASSMGFMTAGMVTQGYKLPPEPYYQAFGELSKIDIALNFLVLEMAFIYKPEHFENDSNYRLQNVPCIPNVCVRFYYNYPEYKGSYIQFDDEGRLVELYVNSTDPAFDDGKNPTGKFVYRYDECSVRLPDAVEQSMIPGPLGKILPLEKGLEPWKYNKKDKKKDNNNN